MKSKLQKAVLLLTLLLCVMALSGCATVSPAQQTQAAPVVQQPTLAPPPAWVMTPRQADFRQRMLNFCCVKPNAPTK